ncbi:MAG: hypothetical protein COB08_006060 [Rhodobacteraceae bacterium]|nr:hypothetical protein [Paracoccaceae bacterium]
MPDFQMDDIRAAVAANVITEAQAARLKVFAESRQGYREHMPADDEPFELFKGFAEIFVTVGLGMLFSGIMVMSAFFGNYSLVPFVGAMLAFGAAFYFTKKRRMNLPSIWLATVFAGNLAVFVGTLLVNPMDLSGLEYSVLYVGLIGMAAMAGWFALFKLPFSMFLFGLFGLGVSLAIAAIISPNVIDFLSLREGLFNLNNQSFFPLATLAFGIATFLLAMFFDMRDPHRVSRFAASGFWLHVLAAVAIVNTVGMSLYSSGQYGLTAAALGLISIVALIIDRRSFLTAGILYMAFLLFAAFEDNGEFGALMTTLLVLGVFITALGTWWASIRALIMNTLPNFPLKRRLPPYVEKA